MAEQRQRAKADAQARKTGHADLSAYRAVLDARRPGRVHRLRRGRRASRRSPGCSARRPALPAAGEGDEVELVLDATPFYAEGGGQQPDPGVITVGGGRARGPRRAAAGAGPDRAPGPGAVAARSAPGDGVHAEIDVDRRRAISRAHTATHLVHQTMRNFLGESATQAGSLNAPGRLRFDFNTPGAVPPSVLHDVEQQVNEVLAARPGGARVRHLAGRGAADRRDGAVRREVRRRGPRRRGRRLRPGAVRRHPRRPAPASSAW